MAQDPIWGADSPQGFMYLSVHPYRTDRYHLHSCMYKKQFRYKITRIDMQISILCILKFDGTFNIDNSSNEIYLWKMTFFHWGLIIHRNLDLQQLELFICTKLSNQIEFF